MSELARQNLPVLAEAVTLLLGDNRDSTRGVITLIIQALDGKAFNVMDATFDQTVGVALYGTASLINHSCEPNSFVVFNGKELILRAMTPLEPGDQVPHLPRTESILFEDVLLFQIFVSYCETMDSKARRQAYLKRVYSFQCSCPRCTVEECEVQT